MSAKVSAIIPTLNAGIMIDVLLTRLERQTRVLDEIIVVDSSSDDNTRELAHKHPSVRLIVIDRKDFDHGGTRDFVLRESEGDFVLFFTQDAMPEGDNYVEKILEPFADEQVALVYGRQLPKRDAREAERLIREFTYGDESFVVTSDDVDRLGIKAFRASDVCAAYRRTAYESVGGFEHPVLTNEDMFISARFITAGWKIVYEAQARVIHSHNFTFRQQYNRNYIQGVEIERHRTLLRNMPLSGEGFALLSYVLKNLLRNGHPIEAGRFIIDCVFRYVGNRRGMLTAKTQHGKKEDE